VLAPRAPAFQAALAEGSLTAAGTRWPPGREPGGRAVVAQVEFDVALVGPVVLAVQGPEGAAGFEAAVGRQEVVSTWGEMILIIALVHRSWRRVCG
jgi:hypothetical protein